MKKRLFFSALCLILLISACQKRVPRNRDTNQIFRYDDLKRSYHMYIPENLPPTAPLVFMLHGYTQTKGWAYYTGFNEIADTAAFAVCYPQGANDNSGTSHWNAALDLSDVDDLGFLKALAADLQDRYDLDPSRTFITGFSNGGFMSYVMACQAPEVFRAVAPVGGLMSGDLWNNCTPSTPVPIMHIHGTNDEVVPIDGSMALNGGWGGAPALDSTIHFWALLHQYQSIDSLNVDANTSAYLYKDNNGMTQVAYYLINNYGHEWPMGYQNEIIAADYIWKFFRNF